MMVRQWKLQMDRSKARVRGRDACVDNVKPTTLEEKEN